ncbi:Ricin-type beta-trefoil lectin domain-containing protein [Actinacidiphila rubida]|uniref:Ricin-type beta-trefoil lectin domain-containing protein n=2 Tax=Actinacidiphila rubida TaxID=310780 RepID=A0A1H8LU17_9ACTN|nr:RICIN domain-containing protein [Actinacidiphila rubida]SEO08637.1 Ricin-type beta-trefoil lectin domain-containing protein [Actinacidiphila rubida]
MTSPDASDAPDTPGTPLGAEPPTEAPAGASAEEPLPTAEEPAVAISPAAARATAGGSAVPSEHGAFAAGFARQRFSGLRLLKPGRRVGIAIAAAVAIAAVGVGIAEAVSHLGGGSGDTADKPAATTSAPATGSSSPSASAASPAATAASPTPSHGKPAKGGPGAGATTVVTVPAPPAAPPSGTHSGGGSTGGTTGGTTGGSTGGGSNPTQKPTSRPVTFTGAYVVNFASSRCLAAQGGSSAPGTQMVLADCDHGDPSQGWTFPSDGTARDFGGTMCLDISGTAGNGATVHLARCSSARHSTQAFVLKSSYDLVEVQPDLCVDAKDKGTSAGTVLQMWSCTGTSNQKWREP